MFSESGKSFCVIDIGDTKISSLVCQVTDDGGLQPLGYAFVASKGVKSGIITDAHDLRKAVASCVYFAEQKAGVTIDSAVVNIPNCLASQKIIEVSEFIGGRQIGKNDVKKINAKAIRNIDHTQYEVIHSFALQYVLDGSTILKNPEGMFAEEVYAKINLIFVETSLLVNIASIVASCHLKLEAFVLASHASSYYILNKLKSTENFLFLDIGGGSTNFAYYANNSIVNFGNVNMGGINVTKDIANYFALSMNDAERIKVIYGDLLLTNSGELISAKQYSNSQSTEPNSIKRGVLNQVIMARMEEILEKLKTKVSTYDFKKIIILGGGVLLSGSKMTISNFFRKITLDLEDVTTDDDDNKFPAMLVGMALVYMDMLKQSTSGNYSKNPIKKLLGWLKENF
jgi:cell division protein FtsA